MKVKNILYAIICTAIFLLTIYTASALDIYVMQGYSTTPTNWSITNGNGGFWFQFYNNSNNEIQNLTYNTGNEGGTKTGYTATSSFTVSPRIYNATWNAALTDYLYMLPGEGPISVLSMSAVKWTATKSGIFNHNLTLKVGSGGDGIEIYIRNQSMTGTLIYSANLTASQILAFNWTYNNQTEPIVLMRSVGSVSSDVLGVKWFVYEQTPSTVMTNFSIRANNSYNNVALNNFSVLINNTNYTTTTGLLITNELSNSTRLYNITFLGANDSNGAFFNKTYYNINVSTDLTAILSQSEIRFLGKERETNNSLTGLFYNYTSALIYNSSLGIPWQPSAGSYRFLFNASGYLEQQTDYSVITPLMNTTINVYNVYSAIVWFNVTSAISHLPVNYSLTFTNLNNSFTQTSPYSDGNFQGYELLKGNLYTFFIDAPGYAVNPIDNYLNYTIIATEPQINFSVYTNNSVRINIYDVNNLALITENISVTFTGVGPDIIGYTINGTLYKDNLTDGVYNVNFVSITGNYSTTSYIITVADRSSQTLNAYLTANAQLTIFTVQDASSGQVIEGATLSQSKLINATYVLIESKLSDISGRVQMSYLSGASYLFTVSKSGYNTKQFNLNPVLFSSYTVNLDRLVSQNQTAQLSDVSIAYTPKSAYAFNNQSVVIYVSSPNGILLNYFVVLNYSGSYACKGGSNAYGELINLSLNITNASITDKVRLYIEYNTTLGNRFNFTYYLPIVGGYTGTNTFEDLRNRDYGLGWLERVLIATGIIIIVAGMVFLIAGGLPALGIGVLLMGFFMYINFIPLWGLLISAFVGIILLSRQQGA